jgi:non-heme chloroperoxidase
MGTFTRRDMLIGGVAALAATTLPAATLPAVAVSRSITDTLSLNNSKGDDSMATITTKDGTTIFYKDWGPKDAQPIVFHHGWPLSSDDWDA